MLRLDEAAAAALGGEFEEFVGVGWTCCYLIYACERVRDYDRAAQWCRNVEEFGERMHPVFERRLSRPLRCRVQDLMSRRTT
jgi:LuxR family transcriptional regulator, maltose regulon positive regulatory protein